MKHITSRLQMVKQESVAIGTGKETVWSKHFSIGEADKISIDVYPESNNMPAGTVLTTYFYRNGIIIGSDTDTLGGVTAGNWESKVHTHANAYKADAARIKVDLDQDAVNVYLATIELTAYYEDDSLIINTAGQLDDVDYVVGASVAAGGTINVALQLKDALGADLSTPTLVNMWFSSDNKGETPAAVDTSVAIGTDGSIIDTPTALTKYAILSEADGDIDIDVVSNAGSWYLNVEIVGQGIVTTTALTWT